MWLHTRKHVQHAFYSPAWQLLFCLLVVGSVYLPALSIPFHGDEVTGLLGSRVNEQLSVFLERMVSVRGFFQRPLSVFSFALNYQLFGPSPAGYHLINILIHLLVVTLLFRIAKLLGVPALVAALLFALHPLSTACASQVYGRPYSLGMAWFCAALCILLKALREQQNIKHRLALCAVFSIAAFLSKQVFLIAPLVLGWVWLCRAGTEGCNQRRLPAPPLLFVGMAVFSVCALGTVIVHLLPNLPNTPVSPWQYAVSQLGNFPVILGSMFILPERIALLHKLPWFAGFGTSLMPWFGAFLLLLLSAAAWQLRNRVSGLLIGCFLLLYLPTNSFVPKGEVVVEWRLYPALCFFALGAAGLIGYLYERFRTTGHTAATLLLMVAVVGYISGNGLRVLHQNNTYSSVPSTYQQVLFWYPDSIVAHNNLGMYYMHHAQYAAAEYHLTEASRLAPSYVRAKANLLLLFRKTNRMEEASEIRRTILQSAAAGALPDVRKKKKLPVK